MGRRLTLALALMGAALLLPAAPAAAAPQWLGPLGVLQEPQQFAPVPGLALDGSGNSVAVWLRGEGTAARVVYAVRPPGGSFGPPVPLSDATAASGEPLVAVDAQGNATAVWTESAGSFTRAMMAERPAGGAFGPPVQLSPDAQTVHEPALAVNAAGDAVFLWNNITAGRIQASFRDGGNLVDVGSISIPGEVSRNPAVGIDADGNAVAAWVVFESPGFDRVRARVRAAGSTFLASVLYPAGGNEATLPDVAMSSGGDAVIVWWHNPLAEARAVIRPAGEALPAAATMLSPLGDNVSRASVDIDPQGNAVAVWTNFTQSRVEAAARQSGGAFGPPATLAADGDIPEVDVGPTGHAIAGWTDQSSFGVFASVRPPGGAFLPPAPISTGPPLLDREVRLAVDQAGNALAAWIRGQLGGPGPYASEYAGYDNAAPVLDEVQVPASAKSGSRVSVSASPFDVIGPVTQAWDFGDGAAAGAQAGAEATHTYRRTGTFQVRATATDAAGFETSATRTIRVTDGIAPRIRRLSIKPRRFPVAPGRPRSAQRRERSKRGGASVRFRLSERARVRLLIQRAAPGRRAGRRCRKSTRRNRARKRCTRHVRAGALTRRGKRGANRLPFSGRISRRALRRGRYRLVLRATDGAGNRGTASKRPKFRIVRR